jgi:ketosteroid isomerase-like protein
MQDLKRCLATTLNVFFLCSSLVLLTSCASPVSEEEKDAALNMIDWNLYYLSIEDLNGVMWTIHEDSPGRADTMSMTQMMFDEFSIAYDVIESELQSIDANTAKVRVIQVTRKISGEQPFRDNRLEAIHTLRKSKDGNWKIYSSEVMNVEYLN